MSRDARHVLKPHGAGELGRVVRCCLVVLLLLAWYEFRKSEPRLLRLPVQLSRQHMPSVTFHSNFGRAFSREEQKSRTSSKETPCANSSTTPPTTSNVRLPLEIVQSQYTNLHPSFFDLRSTVYQCQPSRMPQDIRSFFGGKTATPIREKEPKKEDDLKKKGRSMSQPTTTKLLF